MALPLGAGIDGELEQKVAVAKGEARAVDLLERPGESLQVDQPGMRARPTEPPKAKPRKVSSSSCQRQVGPSKTTKDQSGRARTPG